MHTLPHTSRIVWTEKVILEGLEVSCLKLGICFISDHKKQLLE